MDFHLAQVNVAIAKYAYDDPQFSGFVDNLDRVYALAEAITINDDIEAKETFGEPNLVFNMSVWESKEALREFVYKSDHASILRQRADWFVPMDRPVFALWWQAAGTIPTILESRHRLDRLQQAGYKRESGSAE